MELHTKTIGDGKEELLLPFTAHGITVPAGFQFDGASAPRFFWAIIPPYKETKKAACIHDWMCRNAEDAKDRKRADKLFYTMLREAGLSRIRSGIGYLGVRLGSFFGIGVHY